MNKDYYKTLNINRNASQDEIKKAFRSLSKKHHPDKGGNENRFKEISEAYDTLSSPEKKQKYDNPSPFDNMRSGEGPNMEDIFNQFFRQNQRREVKKGRNLSISLMVTLDDVFFGVNKILKYKRKINCSSCNGLGGETERCGSCHGKGVIEQMVGNAFFRQVRRQECPTCSGRGSKITSACHSCNARGSKSEETTVDFRVPHNLMTGQVYTVKGGGEEITGGHPGDLNIQVVISRHEYFKLVDKDLIFEPKINILDLILGCEVYVPHFDGQVKGSIPPCSKLDTVFTLRGKGMKNKHGNGNLLIKPEIITPDQVTSEEKEIMEILNQSKNFKTMKQ